MTEYYRYLKDGDPQQPQEKMTLSFQPGSTVLTRTTETGDYQTTYNTSVIDRIKVINKIQGCSTCGGVEKEFSYDGLDLSKLTYVDGTNRYSTQYVYDDPADPRDQVGDILQMTGALGKTEERTTSYTYSHRTDDPFLLTQSTETIKSVVNTQQNKIITKTYDNQGNVLTRQESGYVLVNDVSTQKTYTTTYQYNSLGQLTQINGPRTDLSDITTLEYYDNVSGEGNNRGQLKAIVNALSQRTEFSEYDANGNVGKIKDPNNVFTQYTCIHRVAVQGTL